MKVLISYMAVFLLIVFDTAGGTGTEPPLILLTTRHEIQAIAIDSGNQASIVYSLLNTIDVDYDYEEEYIIFNDLTQDKIFLISNMSARSNFSSPVSKEVLVDKANIAETIAYDWVHNNLYWTGARKGTIELLTMKGKHRLTILDTNLRSPRGIAVDPRDGQKWIYWIGWQSKPRIEKAGLDGSHRTLVVATNLDWPNDLTIDYADNTIYWIDSRLQSISSCDLNGQNARVVNSDARFIRYPFSIDVLGDFVYWSNWRTKGIYEVNKNNGSPNARTVRHSFSTPFGLSVYHKTRQPRGSDPCGANNGGCSHICLAAPAIGSSTKKFSCFCPDEGC